MSYVCFVFGCPTLRLLIRGLHSKLLSPNCHQIYISMPDVKPITSLIVRGIQLIRFDSRQRSKQTSTRTKLNISVKKKIGNSVAIYNAQNEQFTKRTRIEITKIRIWPFQTHQQQQLQPKISFQDNSVANNLANTLQLLLVSNLLSNTLPNAPELVIPSVPSCGCVNGVSYIY